MPFVRPFGGILGEDTREFAATRDGSQVSAGRRGNRESQGIVVEVSESNIGVEASGDLRGEEGRQKDIRY